MINNNIKFLDTSEFINDEKIFLKSFIQAYYYPNIFLPDSECNWEECSALSVIVRPECNYKCDYCYIAKYGDLLYPKERRVSNEQLLKNFQQLVDLFIRKKCVVKLIDLFSGDLFHDGFCFKLLDICYNYIKILRENGISTEIMITIPTNVSFILVPGCTEKLLDYKSKFDDLACILNLSLSTDGLYSTTVREKASIYNQEFFDKLFKFANDMDCGFHPMISSETIGTQIENLHWWVDMYKKYDRSTWFYPMMLYVRNDNWTVESISEYCSFVTECWKLRWEEFNGDLESFCKYWFRLGDPADPNDDIYTKSEGFDPAKFAFLQSPGGEIRSCTVQTFCEINLSDFSIPTCHRLAYDQFTAGKLVFDTDGNVDVEPLGASTWIALKTSNTFLTPKCADCLYRFVCIKGCWGSQYESSGEVLLPIDSVCDLQKAHINTVLKLAVEYGVYQYGIKHNLFNKMINTTLELILKEQGINYESN